jgi:hypothetical protein
MGLPKPPSVSTTAWWRSTPSPNGNGRHARIMADALLAGVYHTAPIDWAGRIQLFIEFYAPLNGPHERL